MATTTTSTSQFEIVVRRGGSTGQTTICQQNGDLLLGNLLRDSWQSGLYTDVVLHSQGQTVKCHRVVLAGRSALFAKLLASPKQEPLNLVIRHEVKFWALYALINFMYTGEMKLYPKDMQHIIRAAKMLKIKGLERLALDQNRVTSGVENNMPPTVVEPMRDCSVVVTPLNLQNLPTRRGPTRTVSANQIPGTPQVPGTSYSTRPPHPAVGQTKGRGGRGGGSVGSGVSQQDLPNRRQQVMNPLAHRTQGDVGWANWPVASGSGGGSRQQGEGGQMDRVTRSGSRVALEPTPSSANLRPNRRLPLPAVRVTRPKRSYSPELKKRVVDALLSGMRTLRVSKAFGVPNSTCHYWKSQKLRGRGRPVPGLRPLPGRSSCSTWGQKIASLVLTGVKTMAEAMVEFRLPAPVIAFYVELYQIQQLSGLTGRNHVS